MKIGVIGLGNIAQKAYLPTYRSQQQAAEFVFATRNPQVREELSAKWGIETIYPDVEGLLEQNLDAVVIHSATSSHYQLIKQCLERGLAVYVDKPITDSAGMKETDELLQLAEEKGLLLFVGFNRRYAPMVQKLKAVPDKHVLILQKNRVNVDAGPRFKVFDLFLHVVDTAVYLLDEEIETSGGELVVNEAGQLERAYLKLDTASQTAICSMDLKSGANLETYQLNSREGTYLLKDLTELQQITPAGTKVASFGDWDRTLMKRGFEASLLTFIEAVAKGERHLPSQQNIRLSHALCEKLLEDIQA